MDYHFQKLTPINDADISVYEEAIDFVFRNPDVRNVAISGAYSSGKSSMLESYKKEHEEYKFTHISLAHFCDFKKENDKPEEKVKESVLEGKILNQLMHQIPSKRIPQTNFKVKTQLNKNDTLKSTIFFSAFFISFVFLILFSRFSDFIQILPKNILKTILSLLVNPYTATAAILVCAGCSIRLIFSFVRAQKNNNMIRKISLKGNEIEIFSEQKDSYFDKYLNDVLYLFENVEADVVVFEDMDRFNAGLIFERLREVNTLVNIQRKKEKGENYKPLRFFYLLRDDIFICKDRTKFFDYIIPVVPVVDGSNSYEQFLKCLTEADMRDKLDENFLQSLSLYIDDMRILKNIYNEFMVYIHRINNTDLDWNKMMAMVTYKNLFPRDFSDLQLAKGFVFTLFEQKPLLIKKALETAEEKKKDFSERIQRANDEILVSEEEVDDVYKAKKQRLDDAYRYNNTEAYRKQSEKDKAAYIARKQIVEDCKTINRQKLESQLTKAKREIVLIKAKQMKDLLTRENIDGFFDTVEAPPLKNGEDKDRGFNEIKDSDYFALLKFLVQNGYVDETYADYMTYFYEGSLTANDKAFLRRITDRRGAEYTYRLADPKAVIESPVLREVEFEQEEILNFDLFECLLANCKNSKCSAYLKRFIEQIRKTNNFDFVSQFYATQKENNQFIIKLNEEWPEFFSMALQGKTIPSLQLRQYSIDTLCFCDEQVMDAVNVDDYLAKYIADSVDYLEIEEPDTSKLIAGFIQLGVLFKEINYETASKKLFEQVYKENLYELNFENIKLMLKKRYDAKSNSAIIHKNYTLVRSQPDSPLALYVDENMLAYIEMVIANCDNKIDDDEEIAILLLNNEDLELDTKKQYINILTTSIDLITKIKDSELWGAMVERRIVVHSADNFISYFQDVGLDEALVKYVNQMPEKTDYAIAFKSLKIEEKSEMCNTLAKCNDIVNTQYEKVLVALECFFDDFDAENSGEISDEKFKILIDKQIIQMSVESLEFVRQNYKEHLDRFIFKNVKDYISLQTTKNFNLEEAKKIIEWQIADNLKLELLGHASEKISVLEHHYSDAVTAYIVCNNLDEKEKTNFYASYSQYGQKTKEEISKVAIKDINMIIRFNLKIQDELLSILLKESGVSRDQKIILFIRSIPELNEETCKLHLDELNLPELKGIFEKGKGRKNFEKNQETTQILDALKENTWIYNYRTDERNSERYVITKNAPNK